jgi:hypothetical protein
MRPARYILLSAVVIFAINAFGQNQAPDDIRLWITKEVMVEIAHEQISSVFERFTPKLRYSLSQDEMKNVLESLASVTGPFKEQISQDRRIVNGAPIYVSRSQFENHKVEMGLSFDENNQIADIWIAPVSDMSAESMQDYATAMTDLLRQRRFDLLTSTFNERMKVAMPAKVVALSWAHIVEHLGEFKSVKQARKNPQYDVVDIICEFERGEIVVRVAFDLSGKVGGFRMMPMDETDDAPRDKAGLVNQGWMAPRAFDA